MTAEIADGWLPLFYLPEKADDVWGADLAAGAAKRAADLGPLEIVAGGLLAVGDDAASLRDLARPMIALYVGGMGAKGRNFYNDLVRRYGYEAEAEQIQDLYLDGKKDEAAAAVPDGLLEATTLCGPEGYVKRPPRRLQGDRRHRAQRDADRRRRPRPGRPAQGVDWQLTSSPGSTRSTLVRARCWRTCPSTAPGRSRPRVARAREAFGAWSGLGFEQRLDHVLAVRDLLLDRIDQVVDVICNETGKLEPEALECRGPGHVRADRALPQARGQGAAVGKGAGGLAAAAQAGLAQLRADGRGGRDLAVELSAHAGHDPSGHGAAGRQHRGAQAVRGHPLVGLEIGKLFAEAGAHPDIVHVVTGGGRTGDALVRAGVREGRVHRFGAHRQAGDGGGGRDPHTRAPRAGRQGSDDRLRRRRHRAGGLRGRCGRVP